MNDQPTIMAMPGLNKPAPGFTAPSTYGDISLSDYSGRWVVLFSHPADFTPVCSTEFLAFAKATPDFEALNTQLIGLSIDSVFSHIAWVRSLKDHFGVSVNFPIIADLSMSVAHAYGMVQPGASDTAAVRSVFIIDPQQILRAMVYYPMSNGRSVAEFLRLVEAMQLSDRAGVATPEGWQAGQDVIVPPPKTAQAADARMGESGILVTDWYFSTRSCPNSP